MDIASLYPCYQVIQYEPQVNRITVLVSTESMMVPQQHRDQFLQEGHTSFPIQNGKQTHFIQSRKAMKYEIESDCFVNFSPQIAKCNDYYGIASGLLAFHKYNRHTNKQKPINIYISKQIKDIQKIMNLVEARNQNRQFCNGRGDQQGVPLFFEKYARNVGEKYNVQVTVFKGDDLIKEGFRLMHAVGRGSANESTFINLKYQGNPESDQWVSFVGKGVCFDAGGLNIKPSTKIKQEYLDKCGGVTVLNAFQFIVKQKIKINLTASVGFVENVIGGNAYRPGDIIVSRKGITVEIGNTDSEGRLLLADCMNWTQEKYKTDVLIQLSTLTGAIGYTFGERYAGLFTNSQSLKNSLMKAGQQVSQQCWHMPLNNYYHDLIKSQVADITNYSGKVEASSCQAAAFLENFVQNGTKWVHLDIQGTSIVEDEGTGFGARLLIQYARNYAESL